MSHDRDLRIRRTQKMLQEAFITLTIEVGFPAVTVQMLAERAMINRATFYRHYVDKFDLAEKVYAALTEEYSRSLNLIPVDNPLEGWRLLFNHCAAYADLYLALFQGWPQFANLVRNDIESQILTLMPQPEVNDMMSTVSSEGKVPLATSLTVRYLATAQMGIMQWWLENEQPLLPAQMAEHLWQLHSQGPLHQLITKEQNK